MKTLFTQEGKDAIIQRINKLTPHSQKQWGKMNVSQMLAHAQKPLEVAIGTHALDNSIMLKVLSALFGKAAKKKYIQNEMLDKNSPTAPSFKIIDKRDFEKEKHQLIEDINKFSEMGMAKKLGDRHPFFGLMTHEDWDLLQWKHLDHHLKQFGV